MEQRRIALLGNPNTGKSTVFNRLTGLQQHTGNWSGKTVGQAVGTVLYGDKTAKLYDLPGIYSLFAERAEECCAKQFLCFGKADTVLVVADATNLERNLPLVLQVAALQEHTLLCLNLTDEAEKKGIYVDRKRLEERLGIPVIEAAARAGKGIGKIKESLFEGHTHSRGKTEFSQLWQDCPQTLAYLTEGCEALLGKARTTPFCLTMVLEEDPAFFGGLAQEEGWDTYRLMELSARAEGARKLLEAEGSDLRTFQEKKTIFFLQMAENITRETVQIKQEKEDLTERLDRAVLSKGFGILLMLALLGGIFWLTAVGANYPSALLRVFFDQVGEGLGDVLSVLPPSLYSLCMDGIFLTVSWVVSVMLPPMLIFFPLFTLLEDFGLLPRIAFQADGVFRKAGANGKQALTMCMGFGCNAVGVTACRIIASPTQRLIAMLTNCFVPCNGRFGLLILLCTVFLSNGSSVGAGFCLLALVASAVGMTLAVSFLLHRLLGGQEDSGFILELPPYRRPQIAAVIVRSVLDRTVFVLMRAVAVAVPAGIFIWLMQRVHVQGVSLMQLLVNFLDPLGALMGMSGAILAAFLLGMPANEIVLPILLMYYSQSGVLTETQTTAELANILTLQGWTFSTALCTALFSLNHFPCATTLLTIWKESKSKFFTAVAFCLPTAVGILLCIVIHALFGAG